MRRFRPATAVVLVALMAVLLSGCNSHTDKISDIAGNPAGFANKEVTVAGEVTKVYELPLGVANLAAYRVNDGTGQIWVLSRSGAPVVGDKVGLKGNVRSGGRIAGTFLGDVIEETGRKIK